MRDINLLTIVGGISSGSLNKGLFHSIIELSPEGFAFDSFDISKLPFFSQDLENDPPDSVTEFKEKIREAEAVLFITPEYNRSFPGVLKNAVDWGSRPYGQNLWDQKPAAIMGATISSIGTFGAQHHLRQVLAYLNLHVMGQPEFYFNATGAFNQEGELENEKTKNLLIKFFGAFKDHVQLISPELFRYKDDQREDSPFAH